MKKTKWFETWFDTKYYHILYGHRDDTEAQLFIDNLLTELKPSKKAKLLDLACGKGRHSIFLAGKGYEVTGLDLSEKSIKAARKFETEKLSFFTHDMRNAFRTNYFNCIFNFFTSFGYFDREQDNIDVLENVCKGLKKNGIFVIDYINATKAIAQLKPRQQKTEKGIKFLINRKVEDGYIKKRIRFEDKSKKYDFQEQVRAFDKRTLKKMIEKAGLEVIEIYGNYELKKYQAKTSDRLIIVAQKR